MSLRHVSCRGEMEKVGETTVGGGWGPVDVLKCKGCGQELCVSDYEDLEPIPEEEHNDQ